MKQIAHRVDKHQAGLHPAPRNIKLIPMHRQIKAVRIPRVPGPLKPFRKVVRIAVLATGRNPRATGSRGSKSFWSTQ